MKKLYDLVSKPTAVRKLSCSDCMTATKAFRKSLGVILFIASLRPIAASIAHCAVGFERHGVKGSARPHAVHDRMFQNLGETATLPDQRTRETARKQQTRCPSAQAAAPHPAAATLSCVLVSKSPASCRSCS